MAQFFYGISDYKVKITSKVIEKCVNDNICYIPGSDITRDILFGDPLYGIHKFIYVVFDDVETVFDETKPVSINIITGEIVVSTYEKLLAIQEKYELWFGKWKDELPEQLMILSNVVSTSKVLEIGANIGRSSLIISSCLSDSSNLVSLECDNYISKQLTINRYWNKLNFHIENSALSNKRIFQKGWDTVCIDYVDDNVNLEKTGFTEVNTITLSNLRNKYSIEFDTLFLDCEGAFYFILRDTPEILNGIKLIIMENDYKDIKHKEYIDNILTSKGFKVTYSEAGGWGPCSNFFFQTWKLNEV